MGCGVTPQPIPDWLMHRANVLPTHLAVIAEGRALTYAELEGRVSGLAGALRAAGIMLGDRVAVLATNSVELVEAIHAVPRSGAILVLLNCRLTADELAWQLRDADVRLLLCSADMESAARAAAELAGVAPPRRMPLPAIAIADPSEAHELDEVHSIIYTSGTTGRPKGAMLTFGNFWASAAASAFNLGSAPTDRWLACMPLFHVGGLSIVLRSAIAGTTMAIQPGFDEGRVADALHNAAITHISVVPTMLQRLLDADPRRSPGTLRIVLVGGGPVPEALLIRALARGYPVVQTYGLTETASQAATLSPADAGAHVGSAGKPLVVTRLRIDAAPGEPGEILVAGPTVTAGYFRQPEATAAALAGGWLHTGDIGRLDDDGFLYVLDRRDDLILSGGENVYPAEVEEAICAFPGVSEAAVVGLPDARWGQVVAAAIVTSGEIDAGPLGLFLRGRLAGYKLPRVVERVDSLPRTASGKLQRRLVREALAASRAGSGRRERSDGEPGPRTAR